MGQTSPRAARRLQALAQQIGALPRPLLLAFDVDGTLAPIVDEPSAARVPEASARALRRLAKAPAVRVALVTGRDLASLGHLVRVPGAYRAVEHGAEIVAPGSRPRVNALSAAERARLEAFERWARKVTGRGVRLERKEKSRALHVRELQQDDERAARTLLADAEAEARRIGLIPRSGRAVLEAELRAGDKGEALRRLYRMTRARSAFYIGDDLTDYPAIATAVTLGGLGVFVRSPERPRAPRGASASLQSQAETAELLNLLVDQLTSR